MDSQPRRSSRDVAGSKKKVSDALQRMRAKKLNQQQPGAGDNDRDSNDDEDNGGLFDVVDEETYKSIVKKRRQQGDFVVDDDGAGYADDGEEHLWDEHADGDNSDHDDGGSKRRNKRGDNIFTKSMQPRKDSKQSKKASLSSQHRHVESDVPAAENDVNEDEPAAEEQVKKPKNSIVSLFAKIAAKPQTSSSAGAGKKPREDTAMLDGDDQFDGMLQDLVSKPTSMPKFAPITAGARPSHMHSRMPRPVVRRRGGHQQPQAQAQAQQRQQQASMEMDDDTPAFHHQDDDDSDKVEHDDIGDSAIPAQEPSPVPIATAAPDVKRKLDLKGDEQKKTYADDEVVIPSSSIIRPGDIEEIEDEKEQRASAKQKLFASMKSKPVLQQKLVSGDGNEPTGRGEMQIHVNPETNEKFIDVYWMDMFEDKINKPGSVFVFGKVRTSGSASATVSALGDGAHTNSTTQFASVMIEVQNIQRTMFVLPRDLHHSSGEIVTDDALKQEVNDLVRGIRAPTATGPVMKTKYVQMNYAFEVAGVPREQRKYLMVQYPMANEARGKHIPLDVSGDTFSHVFGSNQSAVEQLILSLNLMGPSWIRIANPTIISPTRMDGDHDDNDSSGQLSWCKNECVVENHSKQISKVENPPLPPTLRVLSLAMKTVVNRANHQHEIVSVSCLTQEDVALDGISAAFQSPLRSSTFTVIRAPASNIAQQALNSQQFKAACMSDPELKGHVFAQPNERALLNFLCAQLHRKDPDVIIGHNISGFELDVLLTRMQALKVAQWSKIGRLKRSTMPKHSRSAASGRETHYGVLTPGRLVLDTYQTARELLLGQSDYTLSSLCEAQRITLYRDENGQAHPYRRQEIDPSRVPRYFEENNIVELIKHCLDTARYTLQLAYRLEALPLTLELTTLGGNMWRRTLEGGRAERIEYLLLHSFKNKNYVVPDKFDPNLTAEALEATSTTRQQYSSKARASSTGKGDSGKKKPKRVVGRQKPAYSGGLVLDPEPGLYDNFILLLDFNSLYPSIIQEYNICFTTIDRPSGLGPGNARSDRKSTRGIEEDDIIDVDDANPNDATISATTKADLAGDAAQANNEEHDDNMGNAGSLEDIEQGAAPANESEAEMLSKIEPPTDKVRFGEEAILPAVIRFLVERRRAVKAELKKEKDPARRKQLDVRQKALKITANSMYGCLGFTASRFYAKPLASLVTRLGRDILQRTVRITNDLGFKVVYGDTDSIMVNTNEKENVAKVREIAITIISSVNKQYKKLELDMDGMMKTLLLCKKKKYAALMVAGEETDPATGVKKIRTEKETKGLDLVRRDWCPLSRSIGHKVLDEILSGKDRDDVLNAIRKQLEELAVEIRSGSVPLKEFQVTKGLNKSPNDYPDIKGQPHLQVAMAMMKAGKIVNTGDHIPYVICKITREEFLAMKNPSTNPQLASTSDGEASASPAKDGESSNTKNETDGKTPVKARKSQASFAERAFHPNEVRDSNQLLQIDHEWYLATQILPPIQRLCEPIDGISQAELAGLLGLDASKFKHQLGPQNGGSAYQAGRDQAAIDIDDEVTYKDCDRVTICCDECGHAYNYPGVFWMPDAREKEQQLSASKDVQKDGDGPQSRRSFKLQRTGVNTSLTPNQKFVDPNEATPGLECPKCSSEFEVTYLQNILQMQIRRAIAKYQQGWAAPDDLTKEFRTRQRSIKDEAIHHEGRRIPLQLEYSSHMLDLQIKYILSLVDVKRAILKMKKDNDMRLSLKKPLVRPRPIGERQSKALRSINTHLRKMFVTVSAFHNLDSKLAFSVFQ